MNVLRFVEAVIIVLIALWVVGMFLHLFGWLLHLLLVVALVAIVYRYLQGRSTSQ